MDRSSTVFTVTTALRALDLEPGAAWDEVRQSYRDLVRVWHPDRFEADARLRGRAEARLTTINAAYRFLEARRDTIAPAPAAARPGSAPVGPQPFRPATPRQTSPRSVLAAVAAVLVVIAVGALAMVPRAIGQAPPRVKPVAFVVDAARSVATDLGVRPRTNSISATPSASPARPSTRARVKSFIARETDAVLARIRR